MGKEKGEFSVRCRQFIDPAAVAVVDAAATVALALPFSYACTDALSRPCKRGGHDRLLPYALRCSLLMPCSGHVDSGKSTTTGHLIYSNFFLFFQWPLLLISLQSAEVSTSEPSRSSRRKPLSSANVNTLASISLHHAPSSRFSQPLKPPHRHKSPLPTVHCSDPTLTAHSLVQVRMGSRQTQGRARARYHHRHCPLEVRDSQVQCHRH